MVVIIYLPEYYYYNKSFRTVNAALICKTYSRFKHENVIRNFISVLSLNRVMKSVSFCIINKILPSRPAKASGSIVSILFPSSSKEFRSPRCEKTLDGTCLSLLWANPNESRFFRPVKNT